MRDPTRVHGGVTWMLSSRTFLEARASRSFKQFKYTFDNNPDQTAGYINVDTLIETGGITAGPLRFRKKMDEGTVQASISHYQDGWAGSHNFKAGVYFEESPFLDIMSFPNGEDYVQLLRGGQPYRIRLFRTPITTSQNITRRVGFFQDQWTMGERLTVNAGVRYEQTEGWNGEQSMGGGRWFPLTEFPERRDQINTTTWAPRIGFAYSLDESKRTALKASYGRYYDSILVTNVPNNVSGGTSEYDWIDANGDRKFQDGEQGTIRTTFPAITPPNLDPNLRNPYVDAVNVGIERQLSDTLGVSVTGMWWKQGDILARTDLAKPKSAYNPVTVTNPLDGSPMTVYALDPAFQTVPSRIFLTNPPELKRRYKGIELVAHRRMANRWAFQGSLTVQSSEGNVGNSFGSTTGGAVYSNPNLLINGDGPLDLDSRFQLKLAGSYTAPHGLLLSVFYTGMSGYPIHPSDIFPDDPAMGAYTLRFSKADNPAIVVEPFVQVAGVARGTYRQDFRNQVNLRAQKDVNVGKVKLSLSADVFNLLNINTVTAVQTLKVNLANFLKPALIENPRALRLGARVEF